jgi:dolichyl-phosphate beta-glucosyltransferase
VKPYLSVILTAYNESENIKRGVLQEMHDYLSTVDYSYEVIINDDGSSDDTPDLIKQAIKKYPHFQFIESNHGGKAQGIANGVAHAQGEILLYTDIDQSTPLSEVAKLLPHYKEGFDVVFGSRGKSRKNYSFIRQLASVIFLAVRSSMLLRGINDTQCGFKSMRTSLAKRIFPTLSAVKKSHTATGWSVSAFDVELLFIAQKLDSRLKEVRVKWTDEDQSTGKKRNFVKESLNMLKQITTVKINDIQGKYDQI